MSLNPGGPVDPKPVRGLGCACGCTTRPRRYPTDLTDRQWTLLEPLLPMPACRRPTGGRPERHCRRQIINALFYLVDNGIKWRAMPADFPPWRTVYGYFMRWSDDLTTIGLADRLRAPRTALGRHSHPSAGCIDAQSVHKSAEGVVPVSSSGYDPHKRVNGRKRHITVDTLGLLRRRGDSRQRPRPARRPRPAPRRRRPWNPPRLGRPGLLRRTSHRGRRARPQHHPPDRPTPHREHRPRPRLPHPAPPLGRRTHLRLDQPTPTLRPRLRTPHRPPRNHGLLVRHPPHDPPPRPAAIHTHPNGFRNRLYR
jgi:transposase